MKSYFPFKFKSSLGYLFYTFIISFAFLFIILNSYFISNVGMKLGFAIPLAFLILLVIYHSLALLNIKINKLHYITFAIASYLAMFGFLYLTDWVNYHILLLVYLFSLSAYTLAWIIYKLVVIIRKNPANFHLITFLGINMVMCLSFAGGYLELNNYPKNTYAKEISNIIINDVSKAIKLAKQDYRYVSYISYDNLNNSLYIGAVSNQNELYLFNYEVKGKANLNESLKYIYDINEMPDYRMVDTFKCEDVNFDEVFISTPKDTVRPYYYDFSTFKTIKDSAYIIGLVKANSLITGELNLYSYSYKKGDKDVNYNLLDGLAFEVMEYLTL